MEAENWLGLDCKNFYAELYVGEVPSPKVSSYSFNCVFVDLGCPEFYLK